MTDQLPISRRKTYELVAERLLEEIGAGRLKPGDPLPTERELTQAYGVGRSSVREALRMLESQGLIAEDGPGSFVVGEYRNPLHQSLNLLVTLDESNLREVYEMRKVLESELAALAAERRGDEDLGRMLTALHEMREGLDSEERYIAADVRFHVAIAEAAQNRTALYLMHALRDVLHRALAAVYHIPGSASASLEQHQAILDAIAGRQPDDARKRMIEHLQRVEDDVERTFAAASAEGPVRARS
jgi:GntR family transcriptional repressor for pyruvate dehydrogenase complex